MRVLAQLNRRERIAVVACLAFVTATLLLSVVEHFQLVHVARTMLDPNYQRMKYTGTIVLPGPERGQCRFTQFDNKTSELQKSEVAECYGRRPNSPNDRINVLRDTFKR
jgi:hypothetical protein